MCYMKNVKKEPERNCAKKEPEQNYTKVLDNKKHK